MTTREKENLENIIKILQQASDVARDHLNKCYHLTDFNIEVIETELNTIDECIEDLETLL